MNIGVVKFSSSSVMIDERIIATSGTAILAMRGSGKSWLNALLAEGLCSAKIPFVIVDPEGEYWTLKVGFPSVVVAGGVHGDLPLNVEIRRELGQYLVEERLELVLDLSDLRRSEQILFLSDFLEEIFNRETQERIPLWISFEEADIWVPQSGSPICKDKVLDICQRGRKRGLGFSLVTQRPAIVDKTALSQTEIRFFKRFQQPQDLRVVEDYLGDHAEEAKSLPSLRSEEALLYAPTLFNSPRNIIVSQRNTPHGGATPEQVAQIKPTTKILQLSEKLRDLLQKKKKESDTLGILETRVRNLEQEIRKKNEEIEKLQMARDVAKVLTTNIQEFQMRGMKGSQNLEVSSSTLQELAKLEKTDLIPSNKIETEVRDELVEEVKVYGVDSRTGLILGDDYSDFLLNRLGPDQRRTYLAVKRSARPMNVSEIGSKAGLGEEKLRAILRKLKQTKAISIVKKAGRGKNYAAIM